MHMRGGAEPIKRSKSAEDPELAKRLWALSEELTGTRFPSADLPALTRDR
jgi:hypothetical protein